MPIPYYHVDVFTNSLFAGNPAGVCILPSFPSDQIMRNIAAENRHSQTAFVVKRAAGDFDLRWFTPKVEDDLCGHATLASAYVLALRGHVEWPVHFHTRSGVLTVVRDEDRMEMDLPAWPAAACVVPGTVVPARRSWPLRNVCTSDRGAGGRGGGRFTREGATKADSEARSWLGQAHVPVACFGVPSRVGAPSPDPQRHAPGCAEVPQGDRTFWRLFFSSCRCRHLVCWLLVCSPTPSSCPSAFHPLPAPEWESRRSSPRRRLTRAGS